MRPHVLLALTALTIFVSAVPAAAAPAIVVNPTRIELGDRERSAEIRIRNGGSETGVYRLSFVNVRMTPEGRLETVETAETPAAADLIRFSPRRVTLAPGEIQVVRVRVRRPANR